MIVYLISFYYETNAPNDKSTWLFKSPWYLLSLWLVCSFGRVVFCIFKKKRNFFFEMKWSQCWMCFKYILNFLLIIYHQLVSCVCVCLSLKAFKIHEASIYFYLLFRIIIHYSKIEFVSSLSVCVSLLLCASEISVFGMCNCLNGVVSTAIRLILFFDM